MKRHGDISRWLEEHPRERTGVVPCIENGTTGPGYTWCQTLGELLVTIPVPAGTHGRSMRVDVQKRSLSVRVDGARRPLVDGALPADVSVDGSVWAVDPADAVVTVQLAKVAREWWASAIEGHPPIDVVDIQPPENMLGVREERLYRESGGELHSGHGIM